MLLILFLLPKFVIAGRPRKAETKRNERAVKSVYLSCSKKTCGYLVPEERMNRLNACVSPACFQEVYGESPLEDGEVDFERSRLFDKCIREEFRQANKRERERERQN